ncbi:MAG: CopD family protein [Planctomycetota bacterium]|jgi:uncharacterized membrane protein
MTANGWILAFHLLALFLWVGQLMFLSRFLGYHVQEPPEVQKRLSNLERRMYTYICVPGGILAITTGLLMLHGTATPHFASVGDALSHYLKPRAPTGQPSFWYVTFHLKLMAVFLLFLCDLYLGRQISNLARGRVPNSAAPFSMLAWLVGMVTGIGLVWSLLAVAGVENARNIGYGAGFVVAGIGAFLGAKLGKQQTRAKFSMLHGLISLLVMLIVFLVLAKPITHAGV